ncbi:MAG: hypothetical protein C5B43_00340, partial [Verrucomicrobia bacterium]
MKILPKFKETIVIVMGAFVSILGGLTYAKDSFEIFPAAFNLTSLNGQNGFAIEGIYSEDITGYSVSGAGDVNGDGIADILVCNTHNLDDQHNKYQVYIVFGSKKLWPKAIKFADLNGKNGFVINGFAGLLLHASATGDVNGDGIDDILIGDPNAVLDKRIGQSYVVFGSKQVWPAEINLADLNGSNGFALNGVNEFDFSGISVSGAGDVNGDGIDDIIIGATNANNGAGQTYVAFGSKEAWPASINLADLNGKNGFALNGVNPRDRSGHSVSGAGDVNGDNIADILIGAPGDPNSDPGKRIGQSYVVFGSKQVWPASINLANLDGNNGFALNGVYPGGESGYSVSGAGDVNGDGIADILIGAPNPFNAGVRGGQSYVVFGGKRPWPASINLGDLNGKNG